jgi:hypothetical protein
LTLGRAQAAFGLLAGASALCRVSYAQQPLDVSSPAPAAPAVGGAEQALVPKYWELGRPRWFLGSALEAGYAYVRPRFVFGYGQPYWSFVGLEAYPVLSLSSVGQYLGVSAALPGITARVGARYTLPFSRDYLKPRDSYSYVDLDRLSGPKADYLALEAELTATVPLWVGSAFAVLTGYRTELAPSGYYLYEESLRAIMKPPYIYRGRLGYLAAFGREGSIRIGAAADVIGLPGRDEIVVRGGLIGAVLINAHLEVQASFIPVIVSPDRLGLAGGDFGQLGVRFRWATDSTPDPARVRAFVREKLERKRRAEETLSEPR